LIVVGVVVLVVSFALGFYFVRPKPEGLIEEPKNSTRPLEDAAMVQPGQMTEVKVISLTAKNFEYSQKEIKVRKGERVRIELEISEGFHDWVVDELGARTEAVGAGKKVSVEFTADKAGVFEFYCSVGKHRQMGMVGKFMVEDSGSAGDATGGGFSGQVLAGTKSLLLDFNQSDYEKALKEKKLVVLYFYAKWCPICQQETSSALYPAFNEVNDSNVIGFRVNYNDTDTNADEKSLARQFGIAYQHTKVFIKNKERILKDLNQWGKDRYITEIAKALK